MVEGIDNGENPARLLAKIFNESALSPHEKMVVLKAVSVHSSAGQSGWLEFEFADGSQMGYRDGCLCPF